MKRLFRSCCTALQTLISPADCGRLAQVGLICNLAIQLVSYRGQGAVSLLLLAYLLLVLGTGSEIVRVNRCGFWITLLTGWLHILFFAALIYFQLSLAIDFLTFLLLITGGWEILALGNLLWPRRLTLPLMVLGFLLVAFVAPVFTHPASGVPEEVVMTFFRYIFIPADLLLIPLLGAAWCFARKRRPEAAA